MTLLVDPERYRGLFIQEAREHIESLASGIERLRQAPDRATVDDLFRAAHSFKGMAATVGYEAESALAHAIEDALHALRVGGPSDTASLDALMDGVDALGAAVDAVEAGRPRPANDDIIRRLQRTATADETRDATHDWPSDLEARIQAHDAERLQTIRLTLADDCAAPRARLLIIQRTLGAAFVASDPDEPQWANVRPGDTVRLLVASAETPDVLRTALSRIPDVGAIEVRRGSPGKTPTAPTDDATETEPTAASRRSRAPRTVRVDLGLVDRLFDTSAEMRIAFQRLEQQLDDAFLGRRPYALQEAIERFDREARAMHDLALDLRTLPVRVVAERFPRMVRTLARQLGKEVAFHMEGVETQGDRSVLDALIDPLTHLLKNAIDHGIEPPEARKAAGKPAQGTLRVTFSRTPGGIEVLVEDDGKGIDPAYIRERAVGRGLLDEQEARAMDDKEALDLLMLPGFTTASQVTDVSGRGVGLDAVKADIERIGGLLRLSSEPGAGTAVTLHLPRTLALTDALGITIDGEPFLIPVDAIVTTVAVPPEARSMGEVDFVDPRKVRVEEADAAGAAGPGPIVQRRIIRPPEETVPLIVLSDVLRLPRRPYHRVEEDRAERMERLQAELRAGAGRDAVPARAVPEVHDPPLGIIVDRNGRRACLLPDAVGEIREAVLKDFEPAAHGLRHIAGATIQGDGLVGLVLDVPSILVGRTDTPAVSP